MTHIIMYTSVAGQGASPYTQARSAKAIRQLEDSHGYTNLVNLTGGILAWQELIDPSLARY